jgi:hypothetical protein
MFNYTIEEIINNHDEIINKILLDANLIKYFINNSYTELEQKYNELKVENENLKIRLKKYTAPTRNKKYYENNKDKILEHNKKNKQSSEKKQEYNKKAYLKRKEKNIEK